MILACVLFLVGFFIGIFVEKRKSTKGTLRVMKDSDEPYLFLELNEGEPEKLGKEKSIRLDVKL